MKPKYSNEKIVRPRNEVIATGMLLGKNIVEEWQEGGHKFRIDAIAPKMVGATMRHYELFCDDEPAFGGRYHSSIAHAKERAHYVAQGSMSAQITYLWGLVDKYRKEIEESKLGDM